MKRFSMILLCIFLISGCKGNKTAPLDSPTAFATTTVTDPSFAETVPAAVTAEPEDPQARLKNRRDLAESHMRHMMSLRWKTTNSISYSATHQSKGMDLDSDNSIIQIIPNQIYQGIPYSHGGGSGYSFLALAGAPDENGVYTLNGLCKELLSGYSGSDLHNMARLGNDCADAVFWAWAQVSGSISFPYTNCMIPSYGCIPVGDYACENRAYAGNTSTICLQNGMQRMFEAYACVQKADALVRTVNSSGHAIMAVSVHVERLEDGSIDADRSYIVYLDQDIACETGTAQYEDPDLGTVLLCEELDKKNTFSYLYQVGYLPVTCKEFLDPTPLKEAAVTDSLSNLSLQNLFTGTIEGSYRIAYVQVQIVDSQGNTVQEAICFGLQEDMYRFDLSRFTKEAEQRVIIGGVDLDLLEQGDYRCRFTCRLGNGALIPFRELDFHI